MFTGIVQEKACILVNEERGASRLMHIRVSFKDCLAGESIAVNGVCLTVLQDAPDGILLFDISSETLRLTNLAGLCMGKLVNIERALPVGARFGGHYVTGHIDKEVRVLMCCQQDLFTEIEVGPFLSLDYRYLIPKGSITLDGVSLTINTCTETGIRLMLIPHTLASTTLGEWRLNDSINVEFDYIARVVVNELALSRQRLSEVIE